MAKCNACGKFIAAKGGAICCKCSNKYHLLCASLAENAKVSTSWKCMHCQDKMPKGRIEPTLAKGLISDGSDSTPTSVYNSSQSADGSIRRDLERDRQTPGDVSSPQPEVGEEIRLLRGDIREMRDDLKVELRELRLEVADLRQTVATYKQRVEVLENKVDELEKQHTAASSEAIVGQLELTVTHLRRELNEREQDLLLSDIEIVNLPECVGENVYHTVELVSKKLGVTLEARDIVYAERVGPRADQTGGITTKGAEKEPSAVERSRRIVVRLARRGLRDELLKSARVRRGVTTADLGFEGHPRRFYLNERLTKTNKQLFYRVRQAASNHGWKFAWTRRGRIMTKETDGKRTHYIHSEVDLERVFGRDATGNENK